MRTQFLLCNILQGLGRVALPHNSNIEFKYELKALSSFSFKSVSETLCLCYTYPCTHHSMSLIYIGV